MVQSLWVSASLVLTQEEAVGPPKWAPAAAKPLLSQSVSGECPASGRHYLSTVSSICPSLSLDRATETCSLEVTQDPGTLGIDSDQASQVVALDFSEFLIPMVCYYTICHWPCGGFRKVKIHQDPTSQSWILWFICLVGTHKLSKLFRSSNIDYSS